MNAIPKFSCVLSDRMLLFIGFKRMQGYDYEFGSESLQTFDSFLVAENCTDTKLHMADMRRYCDGLAGLSDSRRTGLMSTVRQFSIYLHTLEPQSAILPAHILKRKTRKIRFAFLSEAQVVGLMNATETLSFHSRMAPHGIRFLIGLLYSTGLRIAEALALNLDDVDINRATLFVRCGKFRKERLVPLSPSTGEALKAWLRRRETCAGNESSSPLLVGHRNRRIRCHQVSTTFRRLCRICGINTDPPPRIHDLRHNYACRRIVLWREAGVDVDAMLPVLANAMGHVCFHSTQVYIHADSKALQEAAVKFNAHRIKFGENTK